MHLLHSDWRRQKEFHRYDFTDENSPAEECSAAEFADEKDEGGRATLLLSNHAAHEALHNLEEDGVQQGDALPHAAAISDDDGDDGAETNGTTTTGAVKRGSSPEHAPDPCSSPGQPRRRKPKKRPSSRSRAAVSSIRTTLDVCIQVGGEVFWQSSAILQYATPVLVQHLTVREHTEEPPHHGEHSQAHAAATYLLRIPHIPSVEWRLLEPFLQPHARQAAVLTPKHLILLRWFLDLDLQVLLQQSDDILSQLHWNAQCDSLQELFTWSCIAKAAKLPKTSRQVWMAWNRALSELQEHHPASAVETLKDGNLVEVCVMGADFHSLQLFLELLAEWPEARPSLWLTLIRYLPADLEVYTDQEGLLRNPLLPFLLREGLLRAADDENRKRRAAQRVAQRSCGRSGASSAPSAMSRDASELAKPQSRAPSNAVRDASGTASACSHSSPLHQSTSSNALPHVAADDWQSTVSSSVQELLSWLVPSADESSVSRAPPSVCPSNSYCPEAIASEIHLEASSSPQAELLAQVPNNRREWLEAIWQRLSGPPIIPPLSVPEELEAEGPASKDAASPPRSSRTSVSTTPPRRMSSDSDSPSPPRRSRSKKGTEPYDNRRRPRSAPDASFSMDTSTATGASSSAGGSSSRSFQSCRSSSSCSGSVAREERSTAPSVASASFHDTSTDSTLSTFPPSATTTMMMDDADSIGVVRATTRTFYC